MGGFIMFNKSCIENLQQVFHHFHFSFFILGGLCGFIIKVNEKGNALVEDQRASLHDYCDKISVGQLKINNKQGTPKFDNPSHRKKFCEMTSKLGHTIHIMDL